jgi:hypothetical protein
MMTPIDQDALTRAIAACRAQSAARAEQIDSMLAVEPRGRVAQFAAYSSQNRSLNLQPWQSPPCHASLAALSEPFGDPRAARESAELLKKMLALGLSRFEPDPLQAIAAAEAKGVGGCPL